MIKFISETFAAAIVTLFLMALVLVYSAYHMSWSDKVTCYTGLNDTATCKTALVLEHLSNNS